MSDLLSSSPVKRNILRVLNLKTALTVSQVQVQSLPYEEEAKLQSS